MPPHHGRRMDVDGEHLGNAALDMACQMPAAHRPEPVGDAVSLQRIESLEIEEWRQHFRVAGIAILDRLQIGHGRAQQAGLVGIGAVNQGEQFVPVDIVIGKLDRQAMRQGMAEARMHRYRGIHRPQKSVIAADGTFRLFPQDTPERGNLLAGGGVQRKRDDVAFL